MFTNKYPITIGKFEKSIIAGHVSARSIRKSKNDYSIYYDGKNHYYIDGETINSKMISVLEYNEKTKKYVKYAIFEEKIEQYK